MSKRRAAKPKNNLGGATDGERDRGLSEWQGTSSGTSFNRAKMLCLDARMTADMSIVHPYKLMRSRSLIPR